VPMLRAASNRARTPVATVTGAVDRQRGTKPCYAALTYALMRELPPPPLVRV
jgi:hypothetical protein